MKKSLKSFIYSSIELLDIAAPKVSAALVRWYFRMHINDLRLTEPVPYDPLGTYVTFYRKQPRNYQKFISQYVFDEDGIPMAIYQGTPYYQIVPMAQFGLMEYGYYLSDRKESHRALCLKIADKLAALQDEKGGWPCGFAHQRPMVSCTLPKGWYTAMGQGQAISLFARAYALTGNEVYRQSAERALPLLDTPVEEGGLCGKLGGHDFYEEYPTTPASFTLNGMMYCMMGLYDGAQVFQSKQAGAMFEKMADTLRFALPLYDDETVSTYDLSHLTNPPRAKNRDWKYHILHIKLLQALDSVAHDETFAFYIQKWKKY